MSGTNRIVIKIGGVSCEDLDDTFFLDLKKLQQQGKEIIIVHGGGKAITHWMENLAIPVEIKNGLRVTNEKALAVTKMVLLGEVQPSLLQQFARQKIKCLGLNAANNKLLSASQVQQGSLGFVGEIKTVNTELLKDVLDQGYIAIVAPLGVDDKGQWLNINADDTASKIAEAMKAEELILMTEVLGVKKEGKILKSLSYQELDLFIENGTVSGGMIPKLKCAHYALRNGVKQVRVTLGLTMQGTKMIGEGS
ncbi:acetylglutamate kinase [Carnobacterium maltaromaticum]|uniref:Acetylglutamate kinase n=1 Tax=Carnobacterium maltaromaticum TaxID=2751 RepID=A0AAW9K7A5_CARML|nr:acetylglutamate kinase [Carnobacterium maltaromaticum]MDZ5760465.1 acetylglutamate kinase [Carnobacterium maltaromaticum]